MLLSPAQHVANSSSSNSSRCLYAVSIKPLLHSRTAVQSAAVNFTLGPYQNAAGTNSSAWQSCSSGSIGSARAAGVICRDAPRPMWARQSPPPEAPKQVGTGLERMLTTQITDAGSVNELADVYNDWGGSFNAIHAAAALVKCSKLPGGIHSALASKLSRTWLARLPEAGIQGCANVLWASTRLGSPKQLPQVWGPTWSTFMGHVQQGRDRNHPASTQHMSNVVWACAKLGQQPSADELQLLMQAWLRPDVLAAAEPQHVANLVWALSKLCQSPRWQGGVSEQDVQQLLGEAQLKLVAASAYEQHPSNLLVALAGMSAGEAPLISRVFARECGAQILAGLGGKFSKGAPQTVSNAFWACSELGLNDPQFVAAVVAAAPTWVPRSAAYDVTQAAVACVQMQYRNEGFLKLLLQRGLGLVQQQHGGDRPGRSRPLSIKDRDTVAVLCSMSVAKLDMRNLAAAARELVAASGVGGQLDVPNSLRLLWVFHSWLLQHQLLDGKGLTGVLTQQQLQKAEANAAAYGTELKAVQAAAV